MRSCSHGSSIQSLTLGSFIFLGFLLFLLDWYDQKRAVKQLKSEQSTFKNQTIHLEEDARDRSVRDGPPVTSDSDSNMLPRSSMDTEERYADGNHITESLTANISWIPVDEDERQQYMGNGTCFGPLKHCCIGQCRQPSNVIPSTDSRLFRKPNVKLSNLSDLLHLVETKVKKPPESACRLIFLGDSLIGDHTAAAICQLYRLGYQAVKCINKEQFGSDKRYGENTFCRKRRQGPGPFSLFLQRQDEICPDVTLQVMRTQDYNHEISLEPESSGIMVWSDGVHRNKPGEIREFMKENFVDMVRSMQVHFPNWQVLFLEHEPQHFKTSDGNWQKKVTMCHSLTVTNTSNWRNQEAAQTIEEENLPVRIVPLYAQMLPLWDLHIGKGDCTHYCYMPWRFDVTWHGIIEAVEANLRNS
ncbi:unnamed protein product [Cylindrotheca closterium]|uniref:SGNH domain-containing protein n=1 Tax=Cylindrotheca closterium TaxID=2856 RepID=A0AAD2JNT8_9STRA|nr:unnamed protein product [Cylindrotheca closterium]